MRSMILSLAMGLGILGLFAATPTAAHADGWHGREGYYGYGRRDWDDRRFYNGGFYNGGFYNRGYYGYPYGGYGLYGGYGVRNFYTPGLYGGGFYPGNFGYGFGGYSNYYYGPRFIR